MLLGNITTQSGIISKEVCKEVFLLDTKTYTWITNFQTNQSVSSPSSPSPSLSNSYSQSSNSSTGIIIAVSVVGSLIVIISGTALVFFILKHRRDNQHVMKFWLVLILIWDFHTINYIYM